MKLFKFGFVSVLLGLSVAVVGCGVKPAPVPVPVPVPIPVPPAPPTPPEPPAPTVAGVVVVEDTLDPGQARGLFLSDKRVQAFFRNSGLAHAVFSTVTKGPDGKVPADAKKYIDLAAGKKLPQLFIVAANEAVLKQIELPLVPAEFLALFDGHKDQPRAMGCILGAPKLKWDEFGTAAAPGTKLIPRAEWQEVDLEGFLPDVYDQDGIGQCNASATCSTMETVRFIAGMLPVKLSGGDLYSQINNGRDKGSSLEDGLHAAINNGVATAKTVPYLWDHRNHSNSPTVLAERQKYKVVEAYLCPTFDHMASAIQQGFPIVHGLMWYDNFKVDKDGWIPARGAGRSGGHALEGFGLQKRGDVWGVRTRNSWGVSWGAGGNCVIPETHFNGAISGYWAVRSMVRTPEPFPVTPNQKVGRSRITDSDLLNLKF